MHIPIIESCLALSTFIRDQKVIEAFCNGINEERNREACLAVLIVVTGEKQYVNELEKMLAEGATFHYMVVDYFQDHIDKSEQVNQLLKL
jgi:hypothetical protein